MKNTQIIELRNTLNKLPLNILIEYRDHLKCVVNNKAPQATYRVVNKKAD